jgi:hypothetical protein
VSLSSTGFLRFRFIQNVTSHESTVIISLELMSNSNIQLISLTPPH